MSYSNVSICNMALTMLSTSRITSLTQDDENARKCNAIYEMTRDFLLGEHNWNFTLKEAELALSETEPESEDWAYAFALPSDCLRIVRLDGDYDYKIFQQLVYTNTDEAVAQYIAKITDPSKFSIGFVNALATRLAALLAFGVTQNASLADLMSKMAERALKEAKWADAQEGAGNVAIDGSLITERQR
jgi:hypothetical protein